MSRLPLGATVRRDAGLYGYERALRRAGMQVIAGVDEAGRGACAGPLVAGAAILKPGKSGEIPGLADSKLLTEKARERVYAQVLKRALSWAVVVIESDECDRLGMHVANVEALRRAVALLDVTPEYVLTDGFPVDGLGVPGLAVWKGDRVAGCISAASVLAKVTRDRIMVDLDREHPAYDFKTHKGYITDAHAAALTENGPCPQHRMRFVNVRRAAGLEVDPSDPSIEHPESSDELSDPSVEPPDPSAEPVETADPAERVPTVADLVDSTSLGRETRRGESA
ncbi:MAG: ribonuclease HII [Nocardioides sp.]|nr:ribonuclease HII [Nocardioides sp.]